MYVLQLREVAQEKEEACEKLAAATRKADEELDVQKQVLYHKFLIS